MKKRSIILTLLMGLLITPAFAQNTDKQDGKKKEADAAKKQDGEQKKKKKKRKKRKKPTTKLWSTSKPQRILSR